MFDEWNKLRSLKRELKGIEQEYAPKFRKAETDNNRLALQAEYDAVSGDLVSTIENIRTQRLRRRAEKFGIPLMPFEEYWVIHPFTGRSHLSYDGHVEYNRQIVDARFDYWKRWVDILAPTASVVISLLALLIAAIALYLQLRGGAI